jgi:hypothetical protein
VPRKRGDLNLKTLNRMSEANQIVQAESGKLGLDAEVEAEVVSFFKYRAGDLTVSGKALHLIAALRRDFPHGEVWKQMALRQVGRLKKKAKKVSAIAYN